MMFVRFFLLTLLLATGLSHAELKRFGTAAAQPEFLPAAQAFRVETELAQGQLTVRFRITPGYYLYHDRFRFDARDGLTASPARFDPAPEWKDDPNFGRVQVYHRDVTAVVPFTGERGTLRIGWQGCADAGLCYPPQVQELKVGATAAATAATPSPAPTESEAPLSLLTALLVGLGLAFTPCVLPMLPVLAGLIARQHARSAGQGLALAAAYVLGMATSYALLGAVAAWLGAQAGLQVWLQHPAVLIGFAALFALLALPMFGLFELSLPNGLTNAFDRLSRLPPAGRLIGTWLTGLFAALVVSPCVSAPLAGTLLYVSSTGDLARGALTLFVMAWGMGVPLLVLGATEGRLLPKAGAWMHNVKALFGVLLLGVSVGLLGRILPGPVALLLWAAVAMLAGVILSPFQGGGGLLAWLRQSAALLLLGWGLVLLLGAGSGGQDPLRPLEHRAPTGTAAATPWLRADSVAALEALTRQYPGHPVLAEIYADWCTSCKTIEREVFDDDSVQAVLEDFVLVRVDVTANTPEHQALLKHFRFFGPPAMAFYNRQGQELTAARQQGDIDRTAFLAHLRRHGLIAP